MRLRREGCEIAWQSRGSGPALLLVHAFPLDARMWRHAADRLSERYRVITMDVRGFGSSTGAGSIADVADDAAAVLDELGVPMAAIGGCSMGGYVALAFAARHPVRMGALVLSDTRASADSPEARKGRDDGIALLRAQGVSAYVEPLVAKLLSPTAPDPVREEARAIMRAQTTEAIAAGLVALRDRPDRTAELPHLDVATLILVGADDAVTPPPEARAMQAAIPGAQLVELAGCGHLPALEQPERFGEAVAAFLDEELSL